MIFNKAYIGGIEATKAYLGNTLLFDNAAPSGVDVFPQTGAASIADLNNIAPFSSNSSCATSVETVGFYDGIYAIRIEDIADGVNNFVSVNVPVIAGKSYEISVWAKVNVVSAQGFFVRNASNLLAGSQQQPLTTEWANYVINYTETANGNAVIRFYTALGTGSVGDIIYLDKITFTELA
jgi:hypothetical protein